MVDIKFKELMKIFFNSIVNLGKYAYKLFKTILFYTIGLLPLIGGGILVVLTTHYIIGILLLLLEIPWVIIFIETGNKMDDRM